MRHQSRATKNVTNSFPAKRRKTNKFKEEIQFLSNSLSNNAKAFSDGPKIKSWSAHDLRSIRPLTENQRLLFEAFANDENICGFGSAGTGKSYCFLWLALREILDKESKQNRIIIVRSAVATRDQGFLPGTQEEKDSVFEQPYKDIVGDIVGKSNTYEDMKAAGLIEFTTTANIRGVSWNDSIILIDECQNMTLHEFNSLMGRIGKNSRVLIAGDTMQDDLLKKKNDVSGFPVFLKIIEKTDLFSQIHFTTDDIVRSKFCKAWIVAFEKYFQEYLK